MFILARYHCVRILAYSFHGRTNGERQTENLDGTGHRLIDVLLQNSSGWFEESHEEPETGQQLFFPICKHPPLQHKP